MIERTAVLENSTLPSPKTDSKRWQKISENTCDLNNIINHIDLTDIQRTIHPKKAGYK